ncbi:hypothetical protein V6Z12_A11G223200, partial [Gossypium hirsutum]
EGIGVIGGEEAINWGLSGPMLRASGIKWDLRKVDHYECYDEFDWEIQWQKEGDSLALFPLAVKDSAILPTSHSDNPEFGTEALSWIVREVLEKVFEARIRGTSETFQSRCVDCRKKRDRSPLRLEPRSTKHVRTYLSGNNSFTVGNGSGVSAPFCKHCRK